MDSASSRQFALATAQDLVGAASGHGGYNDCEQGIPTETALLSLLAAFGAAFAILYMAATTNKRRRKRRETNLPISDQIADVLWMSLENFENKIHKVANERDDNPDEWNWIIAIFNKFNTITKNNMAVNNVFEGIPGLEPPMLDETWGLRDYNQNKTLNIENVAAKYQKEIDGIYSNAISCRAKMWRCLSNVIESGFDQFNGPEGITSVLKNYLFKIGFQGAFGNVWNAILDLPEARKLKLCFDADEKCKSKEVLQHEIKKNGFKMDKRIVVIPENVQDLDQSDGSILFDIEE